MYSIQKIRVTAIILIFVFSTLLASLTSNEQVDAQPLDKNTTFYFTDILDFEGGEYDSSGSFKLVSEDFPSKQNDSFYPPRLFNGLNFDYEEWTIWVTSTWLLYLLNESEFGDEFGEYEDLFELFKIFFPHPFRILEAYEHLGNTSVTVDGDIIYDLYVSFPPTSRINENDQIKIALYEYNPEGFPLPIPRLINETVTSIASTTLGESIEKVQIRLDDINVTIESGNSLLFMIEILPSDKLITSWIKKERPIIQEVGEQAFNAFVNFINNSQDPTLQDISVFLNEISEIAQEANLTKNDIADILNSLLSSSVVYASFSHPSSVTVPFGTSESMDENLQTYYLHSGNIMNEDEPTKNQASTTNLQEGQAIWNGPALTRSKILQSAKAYIHIRYQDLNIINFFMGQITLVGTLFNDGAIISKAEYVLEGTTLQDLLQGTEPSIIVFEFSNISTVEIKYASSLSFQIDADNTSFRQFLRFLRNAEIWYDAINYDSHLKVTFSETDHIHMDVVASPTHQKVVPGEEVTFTLSITSTAEIDNVTIDINGFSAEEQTKWTIDINPITLTIGPGETEEVIAQIKSSTSVDDGDRIQVVFSAVGKTGMDTYEAIIEVSEDAVTYNIEIIAPENKSIRHGTEDTYHFKITNRNTGIWSDSYQISVISEHEFNLTYPVRISNLDPTEEKYVNVTIFIEKYTNISSDDLTFTVISENGGISKSITLVTTIVGPDLLETFYAFFESVATDLGLDETFGEYAPHFLAALVFLIIFFVLIILVAFLTVKPVTLVCLDRVKEIHPSETATFEVTLKNPTRKPRQYELSAYEMSNPGKFIVSVDQQMVTLTPHQSIPVHLSVTPTDMVSSNDWAEVHIVAGIPGRKKKVKLSVMTMLTNGASELTIHDVSHWPRKFFEGERVVTSFKLRNATDIASKKVKVILYVNHQEKNKVEDFIIPADGSAEIDIPWIAVKGKNEINIVVTE